MTAASAMTTIVATVTAETPAPAPESMDPNLISPGVLAFLSFIFLIVAVALLYRSMSKQLKKVSPTLPDGPADRMREEDVAIIAQAERRGAEQARRRAGSRRPAAGSGPAGAAGGPADGSGDPRPSS